MGSDGLVPRPVGGAGILPPPCRTWEGLASWSIMLWILKQEALDIRHIVIEVIMLPGDVKLCY